MELVEGEDLSQRIARGAIPIDEALPIAKQIAEALEAAHEQGIIHRDLKPANIKVRPDGTVKVLDFGLAKALEPTATGAERPMSPTITTPAMTGVGMILGTGGLHEPRSRRAGSRSDKRSDIWAFGCVLYEMLTGSGRSTARTSRTRWRGRAKIEPDWARRCRRRRSPRADAAQTLPAEGSPKRAWPTSATSRLALEGASSRPAARRSARSQAAVAARRRHGGRRSRDHRRAARSSARVVATRAG